MQIAITTRLPKRLISEVERFADIDHVDRSAEIRKLLEIGLYERRKRDVLEKYRMGKITTEKAAEELGISVWEMLELLDDEKLSVQYDLEDFLKDIQSNESS